MDGDDNHDNYDDDDDIDTCQRDSGLDQQEEPLSLWLQVVLVGLVVLNLVVCHLQGETLLQVVCECCNHCHHRFILSFYLNVETIGFLLTEAGGDL